MIICENVCKESGSLSLGEMLGKYSCSKEFLLLKVSAKSCFVFDQDRERKGV